MSVKELEITESEVSSGDLKDLVLHNDDWNTFEWVIQSLIEVLGHEYEQASQCAHLVHYKGQCVVKSGSLDALLPKYNELNKRKLSVTID